MALKQIDLPRAVEVISQNAWTVLVVDPNGRIREAIPFESDPPIECGFENRERLKGFGVRYIPRRLITEQELEELVADVVRAFHLLAEYEDGSKSQSSE